MLRIWWHRRYDGINSHTSHIPVKSTYEALIALHFLTEDEQDDDNIDMNTGGLEIYSAEDNEWNEWYSVFDEDIFEYGERLKQESENA